MPGEFEERLKAVTVEIEQSGRRIILFIDDIHNLVRQGAGGGEQEGSRGEAGLTAVSQAASGAPVFAGSPCIPVLQASTLILS